RGFHGGSDSAATPPESVYTSVEGPRPISDLTRFFVDRYGETTRTFDALGDSTTLRRANGSFPALVTYVRYTNGRAVTGTYDARGHLTASTDSGVVQGASRATTQYRWNAKWDMVDTVISPLNEYSAFQHDSATGNLTLPRFCRHLNNPGSRFRAEVCDDIEAQRIPVRGRALAD